MMNLLQGELYKLWKDRQIRVISIIMILYTVFGSLLSVNPDYYTNATAPMMLNDATSDAAMILIFLGLVSSAVFAAEYSFRTYKNVIPYVKRNQIYIAKVMSSVIGIFVLLFICYLVGLVYSVVYTGTFMAMIDLKYYFFRFCTHFFMVLLHTGILILISIATKNRVIVNISTVLVLFFYMFIPINSSKQSIFHFGELAYEWGKTPDLLMLLLLIIAYFICVLLGYLIFRRQEVKT